MPRQGTLTLVVHAKNADIIASLVALKAEVEAQSNVPMKLTIMGGAEAHLLAPELAEANVGVIVSPVRSFPFSWEGRRMWVVFSLYPHGLTFLIVLCATNSLPGPPLTKDNVLTALIKNNVTVGIGHQGVGEVAMLTGWAAQNMRWDTAWVSDNFYYLDRWQRLRTKSYNSCIARPPSMHLVLSTLRQHWI